LLFSGLLTDHERHPETTFRKDLIFSDESGLSNFYAEPDFTEKSTPISPIQVMCEALRKATIIRVTLQGGWKPWQ